MKIIVNGRRRHDYVTSDVPPGSQRDSNRPAEAWEGRLRHGEDMAGAGLGRGGAGAAGGLPRRDADSLGGRPARRLIDRASLSYEQHQRIMPPTPPGHCTTHCSTCAVYRHRIIPRYSRPKLLCCTDADTRLDRLSGILHQRSQRFCRWLEVANYDKNGI